MGPSLVVLGALIPSSTVFLVGVALIGVSELALVALLVWVSPEAVGCAALTLGLGVLIAAVGLSSGNLLLVPGHVAIGLVCWMVVAPIAAVMVARARLLSTAPASRAHGGDCHLAGPEPRRATPRQPRGRRDNRRIPVVVAMARCRDAPPSAWPQLRRRARLSPNTDRVFGT
jgi:hypothetical protein